MSPDLSATTAAYSPAEGIEDEARQIDRSFGVIPRQILVYLVITVSPLDMPARRLCLPIAGNHAAFKAEPCVLQEPRQARW